MRLRHGIFHAAFFSFVSLRGARVGIKLHALACIMGDAFCFLFF